MKIFLGILAVLSIGLNIILIRVVNKIIRSLMKLQGISAALLWTEGKDINEELVEQIYEHVNLIVSMAPGNDGDCIYDISEYEDKNIIGLTYFSKQCDNSMNGIVLDATVCHLKNGMWLWREG